MDAFYLMIYYVTIYNNIKRKESFQFYEWINCKLIRTVKYSTALRIIRNDKIHVIV